VAGFEVTGDIRLKAVHRGKLAELLPVLAKYANGRSQRWCLSVTRADSLKLRIALVPNTVMILFEDTEEAAIADNMLKYLHERGLAASELPISEGRYVAATIATAVMPEFLRSGF